jgi:hypothetical protein
LPVFLLLACTEGKSDIEIPAFAFELPGQTAVMVHSKRGSFAAEQRARLEEVLIRNPEASFKKHGDDVIYMDLPEAETGWQCLAESRSFREALGVAAEDADYLIYIDLQMVYDLELRRWMAEMVTEVPPQVRSLIDVLYLDQFRFLVANMREGGGDSFELKGTLQTSGSGAGVGGLFPRAPSTGSRFPAPTAEDRMAVELQFDCAAAANIIKDLASRSSQDLLSAMMSRMASMGMKIADQALKFMSGRVSLRVHESGNWGLIAQVVDEEALADLLDRYLREESGDGWSLPDSEMQVYLSGGWLRAGVLAEEASAEPAKPEKEALFVKFGDAGQSYEFRLLPGVERLDFSLRRY